MDLQIEMTKASLKKLSKSKLIELLLNQNQSKSEIITVDDTKTVPAPRKSAKQMAKENEENRGNYKPVPTPRTYKLRQPIPTPRKSVKQMAKEYEENRGNYKPVPAPRTYKLRQPPRLFGEVPEINIPILKPTVVTTTLNKLPNVIQKTTENVIDWEEWLKNADEAIEAMNMFKPTEPTFTQKEKAMRGFTRSYEISLTNRQDPLNSTS